MDTAKAAIHDLEAVETRQGAVRQAVCTGSEQRPGCQNRRESSRPMAHRQQPRSELRVPQCLLRYAWTSQVVHWSLTQSVRTAGCGPACPVVWQGRAGDRSPYADLLSISILPNRIVSLRQLLGFFISMLVNDLGLDWWFGGG